MTENNAGIGRAKIRAGYERLATNRVHVKVSAVLLLLSMIVGCNKAREQAEYQPTYGSQPVGSKVKREYVFGIFPLHNSVHLYEVYQPIVDVINSQAKGFTVRLESSRDYVRYEDKIRERALDLAIINPYQAIAAEDIGYRIFGKMGDDDRFRGIVVVRKDSGIKTVEDLRDKAISFPAPTAMAATLMTKEYLLRQGLNAETDAQPKYVGSQDSSVMNVYMGLTAAGGAWPPTWDALKRERPEAIRALEIKWRTDSLPSLALVAREDVPEADRKTIAAALFNLHKNPEGRKILKGIEIPYFEAADSGTYDLVRTFLKKYTRLFGKLPELKGTGK